MRIFSPFRSASLAIAGGIVLGVALPAFATSIINLKTDSYWEQGPGETPSITFRMTNVGTTASSDNFIGWVLGLQIVPRFGTTGTVTIMSGGSPLKAGTFNPMPFGDLEISQPQLVQIGNNATINGLTNYWFMGISTLTDFGTLAVGQTYDMGSLSLTMSPDAFGIWDIYTVQQNSPLFRTYWFDGGSLEQQFGNIPWSIDGVGQGNYSLKIGTIGVPEPSSMTFLGLAGLGAGGYGRWRRRRRKVALAGEAVAA
jgi:hypothetical protein